MESSEVFINEEREFSFDDEDYFWIGSYEVVTEGEKPVDCTPTAILEECVIETILDKL